jgi:hypothetical protein
LALIAVKNKWASSMTDGKPTPLDLPQNVKAAIAALVMKPGTDAAKPPPGVEAWYDIVMGHVSGWYKRRSQNIVACVLL